MLDPIRPDASAPRPSAAGPLTIEHIQEIVAEHFNLAPSDLTGTSRVANVAWARQLAIHLSRELTDASLQRIGDGLRRPQPRNRPTRLQARL